MNSLEFCDIVHALNRSELRVLKIKSVTEDGLMLEDMVIKLKQICEKDPSYHIATIISYGIYINRYLPGGLFYYLCEGDKNPEIIAYRSHSWKFYVWLKIGWFDDDII